MQKTQTEIKFPNVTYEPGSWRALGSLEKENENVKIKSAFYR